ncbi:hypothetical protein GCM10007332_23750 [Epilithonimonas arachidiradicis]|uniref:Uncharacterized protein n=1 Tax=Epilithonimonas arachidiradicis TaxID=1617282 RepID=A0ABQ1X6K1_9FLAO|nr:hypothetical protein GCM10007332_23750 [Epilithonimonas arachidiradicis]
MKIKEIQITIMIPIITSTQSGFLLKTNGSIKEANKVDNDKQESAIETLETLID